MARGNEYLETLAKVPLFSKCSTKELKEVARLCDQVDVPAGKTICKQGTVGYECFIIVSGSADVEIDGKVVTRLAPGSYVGELALLDKRPRSATVTISENAHLLVLGPRQFSTAIADIPGLSLKLLSGLAERLREANSRIGGL